MAPEMPWMELSADEAKIGSHCDWTRALMGAFPVMGVSGEILGKQQLLAGKKACEWLGIMLGFLPLFW